VRRHYLLIFIALMAVGDVAQAQWSGDLEIVLAPTMRQYCRVLRFPQGWTIQRFDDTGQRLVFDSDRGEYEFRVKGLLSTEFLVAGFVPGFAGLLGRYDTLNRYKVDLSDSGATAVLADREDWEAAAVVPLTRKSGSPARSYPDGKPYAFHGFQFPKSGEIWPQPSYQAMLLSPDQRWLILLSRARDKGGSPTRVFLDVFNVDTGNKILTINGTYSSPLGADPDLTLLKAAWLTERYFLVPHGKYKERCLVCEFGRDPNQKVARP
jgi:hypothetical protein